MESSVLLENSRPKIHEALDSGKFREVLGEFTLPYSAQYEIALTAWGIKLNELEEEQTAELDAMIELGSYDIRNFSLESPVTDYIVQARKTFLVEVLRLSETQIKTMLIQKKSYIMPVRALASIENIESYQLNSLQMANSLVMVLDAIPDIGSLLEVFNDYGFTKAETYAIIENNPSVIRTTAGRTRDIFDYLKNSRVPYKQAIIERPRHLNLSRAKLASNVAFFDGITQHTDQIINSSPGYLGISEAGRLNIEHFLDFCKKNNIGSDNALKRLDRGSAMRPAAYVDLFNQRGYDGAKILGKSFSVISISKKSIRKNLDRIENYLLNYGYTSAETKEFIENSPSLVRNSAERQKYIARAIFHVIKISDESLPVNPDELSRMALRISMTKPSHYLEVVEQNFQSLPEFRSALDKKRKSLNNEKTKNKRPKENLNYKKIIAQIKTLRKP